MFTSLRPGLLTKAKLQRPFATSAPRTTFAPRINHKQIVDSIPASRITALSNGVRVATQKTLGETATVGVWIDAGSRYETAQNNGVAHFLEHMLFKGTARRSQYQLEVEVEDMGASLNAFTSREQTVYYATRLHKKDTRQALDLLSDMMLNSQFLPERIDRERETILREAQEIEGQIQEVLFDRLHETAFRGSSLSRTILGPRENIENLTREDILKYIQTHYTGSRIVIAAAGDIEHEELVKMADDFFGKIPEAPPTNLLATKEPANFVGSDIRCRYDDMGVAHIAYGFPTAGWTDPDNSALMVMQNLLGSWDNSNPCGLYASSPLIQKCAERDLCTSISPFNTVYSDTGLFGIQASAEPKAVQELMHNVTNSITSLCYGPIDNDRLVEAKNQTINSILLSRDSTYGICEELGRHVLTLGRHMHPSEQIDRISQIDSDTINDVADRFFYDRCFALAGIGAIYELPDYNWLRGKTYWLRF